MVEECHHEATSRPQDEPCKFCGKSFPTWKKLTVHLAKHMEHISLPIIRLVEAKIVDSNTIISPVEPEFTPITPIGYEKREPNSSPFNMMNVSPVPSAQSYFTQPEYQPSNMTAAGFQREPVKASQRSSNYHPAQSPKKVPSYLHNETGDESGQTDSKGNYHQIGPSERPIDDPTASTALEEPLKGHGGPYAVSMPLIGWWRCTGSRGVVEIACGQEVSLEMDGTTCPSCGHIKCQFCESITSPTAEDLSKLGDQHANPEWDVQSLVSVNTFSDSALGSSLPSHMSGSATHELPKTAQEEILLIFFSDQKFRSLLESAASLIGKPRFTRNIRRLLVPFQRELQAAATDNREKDATRIIEKHSQWFASRLFDMSDPENKSNAYNMAAHLNQHIDKRPMLERYLASTVPKAAKTPQNLAEDTNREDIQSSSDESDSDKSEIDIENYINYSKFPNLEHIKNFIIGGATFDNLKQNIFQFLNPQKPPIPSPKISPEIPSEESFEGSGSTETTEVTIPDAELEEESDDTASIASDDPALTGASDARILDPRAYFDKLAALERDIFEVSSFLFPGTDLTARSTQGKRDLLSSEETFHFQAKIENDDVIRAIKTSSSTRLLHLLECYNIIRRTGKSLSTLRNAGYLADAITLLIMDRGFARRRVANMAQIPISKVLHLGLTFEFALKGVLSELSNLQTGHDNKDIVDSIVARQDGSHNLTMQCEDMLFTMDSMHPLVNHVCPIIWDCVVQSLQLGVLSYAGAHIQRFDLGLIGSDISSFQLPIKITYEDKTLQRIASRPGFGTLVKLRRRRFQCLDKLLGGCQPWVFHQNLYSDESDPLLLSTRIRSLTDLWGPSWKIMGERGFIQRYDIGNGSIVPWSENEDYHFSIPEINIGTLQQLPNFEHPHWNASLVSEAIDFFDFLKKSAVKLGMVKSTL
jgi:hypothetical protein